MSAIEHLRQALEEPSALVKLAKTFVARHLRPTEYGIEDVEAHWRTFSPAVRQAIREQMEAPGLPGGRIARRPMTPGEQAVFDAVQLRVGQEKLEALKAKVGDQSGRSAGYLRSKGSEIPGNLRGDMPQEQRTPRFTKVDERYEVKGGGVTYTTSTAQLRPGHTVTREMWERRVAGGRKGRASSVETGGTYECTCGGAVGAGMTVADSLAHLPHFESAEERAEYDNKQAELRARILEKLGMTEKGSEVPEPLVRDIEELNNQGWDVQWSPDGSGNAFATKDVEGWGTLNAVREGDGYYLYDPDGKRSGPFATLRAAALGQETTLSFEELVSERRTVLGELGDLEANAPNPREGADYIARRDAYYARKALLQARAEELTLRMQALRT